MGSAAVASRIQLGTTGVQKSQDEVFTFRLEVLFMFVKSSRRWTTASAGLLRNVNSIMRPSVIAISIWFSMGSLAASTEVDGITRRATSIAPQDLALALQILAKDRSVQLVYRSELVSDRRTRGATGVLTLEEALTQLLHGSGLMYRYLDENAITIVREK